MKGRYLLLFLIPLFFLTSCGTKETGKGKGEVGGSLPDTIIEEHPASTTSDRNATFTFAASEQDVYFMCNLDDGGWSTCASPVTFTALSEGKHDFKVKAVNFYGGEDPTPAEYSWSVVNYQVMNNGTIEVGDVSGSSVDLSGQITSGDRALCSVDGGEWQDCDPFRLDLSKLPDGEHTVEIKVLHLCKESDDQFCSEEDYFVDIKKDTTPPDTMITSSPPAIYNSRTFTFAFISSERGTFQCSINWGEWFSCSSPYSGEVTEDGDYISRVRAVDEAGNVDPTPAEYRWHVDTKPPVVSFGSVPSSPSDSPYATVEFISSEDPVTFFCSLDGGGWDRCTSPFNTPFLKNGSHTIRVYAVDLAGNRSEIKSYNWGVNVPPPDTIIDSKPETFINYTDVTLTFHSDKNNVIFQCKFDGNNWVNCNSPVNYSNLPEGEHTFQVVAIDQYGYRDPTPASFSWYVDLTPPVLTINNKPRNPTDFKSVSFSFSSNEALKYFKCKLDNGSWEDCGSGTSSSKSFSNLGSATHTFYLKGEDLAGNDTTISYQWRIFSWKYVSAGGAHTCAIRDDNSLWCWGENNYGQLGVGDTNNRNIPVKVTSWSWKVVSAGGYHTCAVATNNVLDCWGFNYYGELGVGDTQERYTPAWVGNNYDAVSSGYYHTCAINTSGGLYCWGCNNHGQVGDGTTQHRRSPVYIGSNWMRVSTGGYHSCGINGEYYLYCWGDNEHGQLGDGTNSDKHTPNKLPDYDYDEDIFYNGYFVLISLGYYHTTGIEFPLFGEILYTWGDDEHGEIGYVDDNDRHLNNYAIPFTIFTGGVGSGTIPKNAAAGGYHTCAIVGGINLYCWGRNDNGQLGLGDTGTKYTPRYVSSGWDKITAGYAHTCGIKTDGTLWCWGWNGYGQLGVGDTNDRYTPTHVYPSPWP